MIAKYFGNMFLLLPNFSVAVFFGLSTFVITTSCCSSQLAKNFKWGYVSYNDRNNNVMLESLASFNNNQKMVEAASNSKEAPKNFSLKSLTLDKTNGNALILSMQEKVSSNKRIRKTHSKKCPQHLDLFFCLNGGSCLNDVIGKYSEIFCECPDGYWGERCHNKYILNDKSEISDSETARLTVIKKCDPDFDLLFCLNGGSCFNYIIGDSSILSCLCTEGYYGERCNYKYTMEEVFVSHECYNHNHHNGHIIRKAKIYVTPFVAALLIIVLLYTFIGVTFLDLIRKAYNRKFYNRTKHKIFNYEKMKYFIYFLIRKN